MPDHLTQGIAQPNDNQTAQPERKRAGGTQASRYRTTITMRRYLAKITNGIKLLFEFHVGMLLKTRGKLRVYKNAEVELRKNANIEIGGRLEFNAKWTKRDPFPSILAMRERSSLIVKSNFCIYSGSRVYINQGASLILGSGYINNNLSLSCFEKIEIG